MEGKDSGVKDRIKSIDVFRGLTIALMLIVETPGNTKHVFPQLLHAKWDGLTITDLVFPFFIFIAGLVTPVALRHREKQGKDYFQIILHIVLRALVIFLVGLILNGFPDFDLSSIRIMGVLQRIAIVYLIISLLGLISDVRSEAVITAVILIAYFLLMKFVFVPGFGRGNLLQNGNLVQFIDKRFISGHMYSSDWDPEGILSTLPAVATGLMGMTAGRLLFFFDKDKNYKLFMLLMSGIGCLVCGLFFSIWFPINKNLWSSSFVLVTGAYGLMILGILYFMTDILKINIFRPFMVLGRNAIFIYISLRIMEKSVWVINVDTAQGTVPLNVWLCGKLITPWAGNVLDSLYFSILYMMMWIIISRLKEVLVDYKLNSK